MTLIDLQVLVSEDPVVCPRCGAVVGPDVGGWGCCNDACPYATDPNLVVAGVPALVDFEHSVLPTEALTASAAASLARKGEPAMTPPQAVVHYQGGM